MGRAFGLGRLDSSTRHPSGYVHVGERQARATVNSSGECSMRTERLVWRLIALLLVFVACETRAETVARRGAGWLERIDGYPGLHLKGTPYEMGRQHGTLLKIRAIARKRPGPTKRRRRDY